jgi:tellurite resistance protein TerB
VVERTSGLIQSLVRSTANDAERIADVMLMTALADGFISDVEFNRIREAMLTYAELEGITAQRITERANELRDNAPLFSEPRDQLVRELVHPKMRRLAITLAAKLVGFERPLQEEERALLYSLAQAFRIPDAERNSLLAPWTSPIFIGDTNNYERCLYNAPGRIQESSIFDAMASSGPPPDPEFKLLVHKVSATRSLIAQRFEGAEIHAIGEVLRVGPYGFRIDALFAYNLELYVARFLGPGEALHPLEHAILSTLMHRLDDAVKVLVVHAENLSSSDRVFLSALDPAVIRVERLET